MIEGMIVGAVVGAVLLLVGFIIGRAHHTVRSLEPPAEICLCGHAVSFHDKANGCMKPVGLADGEWQKQCACVRYVGPNSSYIPELDN